MNSVTCQELHALYYITLQDLLHIKIAYEFDIHLYLTFFNIQASSRSNSLEDLITLLELHALCCNFMWRFSTSKYEMSLILTFV